MMGSISISVGEEGGLEIGRLSRTGESGKPDTGGDPSYGLNIVRCCHHSRNYWFRSPSRYQCRPSTGSPRVPYAGPSSWSRARATRRKIQVRCPPSVTPLGSEEALRGRRRAAAAAAAAIRGYTMPRADNVSCETTVSTKFTFACVLPPAGTRIDRIAYVCKRTGLLLPRGVIHHA